MKTALPAAYLLTFRTYGSWLHGDARGSVHHREASYGAPLLRPSPRWEAAERARLRGPAVLLSRPARDIVEQVIADVCAHRGWMLRAANARTNHVHAVVSAAREPEAILVTVKAWATRRLVEAGRVQRGTHVWSRHGSTIYLWDERSVESAAWYVLYEQGE
ncbi:MAG TPA: hypothetical protein VGL81_04995 [Polyangiaceae bacterium]|jgi:REP element-mobilizing transposase RayT